MQNDQQIQPPPAGASPTDAPAGQPVAGAPPVGQPGVPGQPPADGKTEKQRKKEEAEKLKKIQQEKRRQLELNVQVSSFSKTLANSVIDVPTMFKITANTLKTMLNVDHVAIGEFEEHSYIRPGLLCIGRGESPLPKLPKPKEEVAKKDKDKKEKKDKKKDDDKEPEKPKPIFPMPPKEPPKPGTLPRLENVIWDMPLLHKIKDIKQPAYIPDSSKFPDPEVNKFAGIFLIKTLLFLPLIVNKEYEIQTEEVPPQEVTEPKEEGEDEEKSSEPKKKVNIERREEVVGIVAIMTVGDFKPLSQIEIQAAQKAIQILARSVENAPPDLPDRIKKVITLISKDESGDKLTEYYSEFLDDIFDLINYEVGADKTPDKFQKLCEIKEKLGQESKIKKIWFQIHQLITAEEAVASIARRGISEIFDQSYEYTQAKNIKQPAGFNIFVKYVQKNLKFNELKDLNMKEEVMTGLEERITNAIRGEALFTSKEKATLMNDIEQSNMLINYISAPAAVNFRDHIKAAMEETNCPEEVEKEDTLTDLCYFGMAEISKGVCQDLIEKELFELPEFLEQPQEKQAEITENLVTHFHRKIMSNLMPAVKGVKHPWIAFIANQIKEKAKEAIKKRAVLVGRMGSEQEEEEE